MVDGWEAAYGGLRHEGAVLSGYARGFNKASVANWGTRDHPCPTLGLEPGEGAECVGCAFEFPEARFAEARAYLRGREGPSFALETLDIRLPDGRSVPAVTAVNDRSAASYLGHLPLEERCRLVGAARGTSGSCVKYALSVRDLLRRLGVRDPAVESFAAGLGRER
jgi:cation transport protein ChaC